MIIKCMRMIIYKIVNIMSNNTNIYVYKMYANDYL